MAISFVSASPLAASSAVSTSLQLSYPTGWQADDILIAQLFTKSTGTNNSLGMPGGWTSLGPQTSEAISNARHAAFFWRRAGAGDASTVTMTHTTVTGGVSSVGQYGVISAWRGVTTAANPFDAVSTRITTGVSTNVATAPSLNLSTGGLTVVKFYFTVDDNDLGSPSSPQVAAYSSTPYATITGTDCALACGYFTQATSGATGTHTFTLSTLGPDIGLGFSVALIPASAPTVERRVNVSWAEFATPNSARRIKVSWSELAAPDTPRRVKASWAALSAPDTQRRAKISWAEFSAPDISRRVKVSWAELATPNAARQVKVSWAELATPNAQRRVKVSWGELAAPDTPRRIKISWGELSAPDAPRRAKVSWAEFSAPDVGVVSRNIHVSWAELAAPDAARQVRVSWAELSAPNTQRRIKISWGELATPDAPRRVKASWAELSAPDAPRRAKVSWGELATPDTPRRAKVSWAEFSAPDVSGTDRRIKVSWAEMATPNAPRRIKVSWGELSVPDVGRRVEISWAEVSIPDVPAAALTISGRVRDKKGKIVEGATVLLFLSDGLTLYNQTVTDATGLYSFSVPNDVDEYFLVAKHGDDFGTSRDDRVGEEDD